MAPLARWCFRHRRIILPAWLLALVLTYAISHSLGSTYSNNFSFPATDSSRAQDIVKANFPSQSGDSDQIVVQAKSGTLADPATKAAVTDMLANVQRLPFVTTVTSPYQANGGLVSKDGTIGIATVNLNAQPQNISKAQAKDLIHTAQAAKSSTLNVQLGGAAIQNGENQGGGSADFLGGAVLALLILFFAFRRSVLCALLPLISALAAIGVGTAIIAMLTHALTIPKFATQLAELIALGVGVDYALFIVNRHRRELLAGHTPEEAAVRALNTSGRAVLIAGLTVCIALLGMFALGLDLPLRRGPGVGRRGRPDHAGLAHLASRHARLLRAQGAGPAGTPYPGAGRRGAEDRRRCRRQRLLAAVGADDRLSFGRAERRRPGRDRRRGPAVLQHSPRTGRLRRGPVVVDHPPGVRPGGQGLRPRLQRPSPGRRPDQRARATPNASSPSSAP